RDRHRRARRRGAGEQAELAAQAVKVIFADDAAGGAVLNELDDAAQLLAQRGVADGVDGRVVVQHAAWVVQPRLLVKLLDVPQDALLVGLARRRRPQWEDQRLGGHVLERDRRLAR